MTHIFVGKLPIIGSYNGLSPGRNQAIIRTNDEILLIGTLGTNFNEILSEIHTFSFNKMHLKMSSGRWRPFCLGLNVLKQPTSSDRVHINEVIGDMLWNSSRYSSSYPLPCITKGSSSHFSPSLPSFIQDTAWWIWGHKCHWDPRGTRYFLSWGPQWNQIARFMGPRWGPSGADRAMLAPWTFLSGKLWLHDFEFLWL